eukprot:EG_transcript_30997
MRVGAELGVQQGKFSNTMLLSWPSCEKYFLIDAWMPQSNYRDMANRKLDTHLSYLNQTKARLQAFAPKTVYMRMLTSEAAPLISNESLDFVYVDARHDFCGVTEDLGNYWPKLRPGGIMAGHDFLYASDVQLRRTNQNWFICGNGTRHPGAVKGAVLQFARSR